jgi:hypothetical protein
MIKSPGELVRAAYKSHFEKVNSLKEESSIIDREWLINLAITPIKIS